MNQNQAHPKRRSDQVRPDPSRRVSGTSEMERLLELMTASPEVAAIMGQHCRLRPRRCYKYKSGREGCSGGQLRRARRHDDLSADGTLDDTTNISSDWNC